jgi:hypothetical protein
VNQLLSYFVVPKNYKATFFTTNRMLQSESGFTPVTSLNWFGARTIYSVLPIPPGLESLGLEYNEYQDYVRVLQAINVDTVIIG